jgi:hypothetical protein
MLLVGGIVIAAIVVGAVYAMSGSKGQPKASPGHSGDLFGTAVATGSTAVATPTPGGGGGGSVTFEPSSFSCSDTNTQVMMAAWLPASIASSEQVTAELDGKKGDPAAVADGFEKQADGRWLASTTSSASNLCGGFAAGKHTLRVLDSQGKVLAQGSFTNTAATATPTPGPVVGGTITVTPSTFSCSDSSVQVALTIWLAGSVSAAEQVTGQTDGSNGSTQAVGDGFTKQSDGRWMEADTLSGSDLCSSLATGAHTLTVVDSQGNVLASGSFTLKP